jgi:hypothetical protein
LFFRTHHTKKKKGKKFLKLSIFDFFPLFLKFLYLFLFFLFLFKLWWILFPFIF